MTVDDHQTDGTFFGDEATYARSCFSITAWSVTVMATAHLHRHQASVLSSSNLSTSAALTDAASTEADKGWQYVKRRKQPGLRQVSPAATRLNNVPATHQAGQYHKPICSRSLALKGGQGRSNARQTPAAAGKENHNLTHVPPRQEQRRPERQTKPATDGLPRANAASPVAVEKSGAATATALVPVKSASSSAAKQNKDEATLLGSIPRGPYAAPVAYDVTLTYINGLAGRPMNGATRVFPLGFSDSDEHESLARSCGYRLFLTVAGDLLHTLENDVVVPGRGMDAFRVEDAKVGVRGSSVTGRKWNKPNIKFNDYSDIDFFVESTTLAIGHRRNDYSMVHPDQAMASYPALAEWSQKWTQALGGRKISPAIFPNGQLPNTPAIIVEKKLEPD
jgi:hypothetical protein